VTHRGPCQPRPCCDSVKGHRAAVPLVNDRIQRNGAWLPSGMKSLGASGWTRGAVSSRGRTGRRGPAESRRVRCPSRCSADSSPADRRARERLPCCLLVARTGQPRKLGHAAGFSPGVPATPFPGSRALRATKPLCRGRGTAKWHGRPGTWLSAAPACPWPRRGARWAAAGLALLPQHLPGHCRGTAGVPAHDGTAVARLSHLWSFPTPLGRCPVFTDAFCSQPELGNARDTLQRAWAGLCCPSSHTKLFHGAEALSWSRPPRASRGSTRSP